MSVRGPFVVLVIGVIAASCSSILIRHAQSLGIDSLAIAAWRLILAAAVLLPFALARRRAEYRQLSWRDYATAVAAGVLLALHFVTWIRSLALTSVASSAALVATNPIWVGIATMVVFRERLPSRTVTGIGITLVGCAMVLRVDATLEPGALAAGADPSAGNLLALAGALFVSGYLLLGRSLSDRLSLLAYLALVYGTAAIVLTALAVGAGVAMGDYSTTGWLLLAGLAAGPQLIGHSAFNWALRHLTPTFVALAILGEPVGSALLAALWLGEIPDGAQTVALLVLLAGILGAGSAEGIRSTAPVASAPTGNRPVRARGPARAPRPIGWPGPRPDSPPGPGIGSGGSRPRRPRWWRWPR